LISVRLAATQIITRILQGQGSLSSLLAPAQSKIPEQDKSLLQQLCFGACRYYPQLDLILAQLLEKPLRNKDLDIKALLIIGLYQLQHTRVADHAAISETVEVTRELKKDWASKLVNGVLRRFQREQQKILEQFNSVTGFQQNHPEWLVAMLKKNWPDHLNQILAANDQHPPFCLRLNTKKISRADYLNLLAAQKIEAEATQFSPYGIRLAQACSPTLLPFFDQGWISVQDEAAQLTADLLQVSQGQKILDACAAPGGKTTHLLELEPDLNLTALDMEERRLVRLRENLVRLELKANVRAADASQPESWWDGNLFDRILLDAPCSATGIIRRHPDIKILRQPDDIQKLADLQLGLLKNLWPLVKPGGILLYATCSILQRENSKIIQNFLQQHTDAVENRIEADWGEPQIHGRQLFPQVNGHDGFYYARLVKNPERRF
jgi:16S rRNA (cytosine967-C5)-methyltransferase